MAKKGYKLSEPKPTPEYQEWAEAIIMVHPEWRGKMDKELVQLIVEDEADRLEVATYILARKIRKYA